MQIAQCNEFAKHAITILQFRIGVVFKRTVRIYHHTSVDSNSNFGVRLWLLVAAIFGNTKTFIFIKRNYFRTTTFSTPSPVCPAQSLSGVNKEAKNKSFTKAKKKSLFYLFNTVKRKLRVRIRPGREYLFENICSNWTCNRFRCTWSGRLKISLSNLEQTVKLFFPKTSYLVPIRKNTFCFFKHSSINDCKMYHGKQPLMVRWSSVIYMFALVYHE